MEQHIGKSQNTQWNGGNKTVTDTDIYAHHTPIEHTTDCGNQEEIPKIH